MTIGRAAILLVLLGALGASAAGPAATDNAKITYIKSFPKSQPAYIEISLWRGGKGDYKEAPDDENPLKFQLTEKETSEIFELAEKAGRFAKPLESGLKVAFTGNKTFRWEDGTEKHEATFNYSTLPEARQLWDWFERITETELRFATLERTAKFDRLGVNDALLELQVSLERNRLVATAQFLPLLDRIAKNGNYMHMARERAASLADAFRKESN